MTRILFIFTLYFVALKGSGQIHFGGSYAITTVCKDGILMIADSRGSIYGEDEDKIYAYFGPVPKVFMIRNCGLTVTGSLSVNDTFLTYHIQQLQRTLVADVTPSDLLQHIYKYFSKFPSKNYGVHFTAASYLNDSASICILEGKEIICGSPYVASDTLSEFNDSTYEVIRNLSSKQVLPMLKKIIIKYANSYNKNYKISGPFSVLKIIPGGKISWLENGSFDFPFADRRAMLEAYKKGEYSIIETPLGKIIGIKNHLRFSQ